MAAQNQGDLFDSYFRRADLDGNGKISGAEAVGFFQGANLPQRVLAQIWNYADQNRAGSLGRAEFYNALKLVTVAQSKRELTPDIVKAALFGPASAKIPAPQINSAAVPGPHPSATGTTPSASPMGNVGSATTQNPRFTPPLPNTTMNQQYSQPPGSGLVGPPNSVSGVAARPPQGVGFQGYHEGPPSMTSNPSILGPSSAAGVLNPAKAPLATPSQRGNSPLPNQTGLPSAAPLPVASVPSKSPVVSGVPSPSTTQLRPSGTQNGFPNMAGGRSVGGQHANMQPHVRKDAQNPAPNFRPSGPPVVSPQTSTGHHPQQQWPRLTQTDIQKYTKVFMEVDSDKDGKISGDQARNLFLSWKLPREVLRQVWNLSDQDSDSMLSVKEFCIALYLMERYREGRPLPAVLPSSVILDLSSNAQPASGYGNSSWGYSAGFQQPQVPGAGQRPSARPPGKPPLPVPAPLADDRLPPKPQKAKVPVLEKHLVDQLSEEEQKSLNLKFQEASEANKKVEDLEKEIKESREKMEFYRVKMQELVLYKSRCDSRLNEVSERAEADKREVESLAKKYEEKYLQDGNVASKLTIEEATFRDIQERKMEMYQAVVKMEQDGGDETLQVRADRIQSNLEELVRSLSERCKKYGLRSKPTTLVELPFGWQPGIQEGAADWDEDWDKFEEEGFTFVKELTLDVQNLIAPPKPKIKVLKKEKVPFEGEAGNHTSDAGSKSANPAGTENGVIANHKEDNDVRSPVVSPSGRSSLGSPRDDSNKNQFEKTADTNTSPRSKQSPSDTAVGDTFSSEDKRFDEPTRGTFDTTDDTDSVWGNSKVKGHERHIDDLFGHGEFTLPPIRTSSSQPEVFLPKKSIFDESVPSTPAEVFLPKKSIFADSVPGTPAEGFLPKPSIFADSVPSTPLFKDDEGQEGRGFNFSRFDSFRSTDSGLDSQDGGAFQRRETFSRFDSMKSTTDSDFGLRFSSFDGSDPFGSDAFKSSFGNETPRRDSDAFESSAFRSSFGAETPRSDVDPFGSVGPYQSSVANETPRTGSDPFGSVGPFRSSLDSETPRADTGFYDSAGPFSSSFGNETPRADNDYFSSAGPFGSSFASETPRADTNHFSSVGPFGSSMGGETPRKESDYFGYSNSFKSSFDSETPRGEFDSFGMGGPFGSETPRHESDPFGSSGQFKSSIFSETPKGRTDSWSAF